jgi:3-isopropylmalate/(R)-2-methylmalate dehydratase large subunit
MGMTIAEKILARASGKKEVQAGEVVLAESDLIVLIDVVFDENLELLEAIGKRDIKRPGNIIFVIDHCIPPSSTRWAETHRKIRKWTSDNKIRLFDYGNQGISHQLPVEQGLVKPGMLITNQDTHVNTLGGLGCFATATGIDFLADLITGRNWYIVPGTIRINLRRALPIGVMESDISRKILQDLGRAGANYKAIEFSGPALKKMGIDSRMTLCNRTTPLEAKTAIVEPDEIVSTYIRERTGEEVPLIKSDPDAKYSDIIDIDCNHIEPLVAAPHDPSHIKHVDECSGEKIDQAYIGSCASGRIHDLQCAAEILRGHSVRPDVRLIITPSSQEIFVEATRRGLTEVFLRAGAIVNTPGCAACWGYIYQLADGETCITTSTENTVGRMGSRKARIYQGSPLTVAASAVAGTITNPATFLKKGGTQ